MENEKKIIQPRPLPEELKKIKVVCCPVNNEQKEIFALRELYPLEKEVSSCQTQKDLSVL